MGLIDMTGSTVGNLTVLGRDTSVHGGGKHAKWICKCKLCGNTKSMRGSDLRSGGVTDCGCKARERWSNARLIDRAGDTYGHLKVIRRDNSVGIKGGQHARWMCRCDLCGTIESVSAIMFSDFGKDRCRNCMGKSLGEARISDILDANGIRYVRDKSYKDCVNDDSNYHLRFDFRIINDENDCLYMIEYDGAQHFKPAPMWDNNGDLEERQRRDSYKTDWCLQNGVALIRIPYTHYENICIDDLLIESSNFRVA